jgi:putative hemolysin
LEIVIVLLLIGVNGFFALSEIAFVSSRREIIESEKDRGNKNAGIVLNMMDEPDRFLSSIQVGITLIGIMSGVYGGIAIADDISKLLIAAGASNIIANKVSIISVVGIITYLSIVLGELVPKTIGLKSPERVIVAVIPFVKFFSLVTHPVVSFLSWSTKVFLRIVGVKPSGIDSSDDPLKEILGIAKAAAIKNKISSEQAGIIVNTARLRSTKLYQIMVKRIDMKCLTTNMSLQDALIASHVHHHTRFPFTDENTGEILGYINFKDIVNSLRINPANPSLRGISRPMVSFRDKDTINFVLRRLITTHQHIALVRDDERKVVGMVTMEDILETIVGDIQDEYDVIPDHLYEISPDRFVAGGGVTLKRVHDTMEITIPNDDRTIDKWIREQLGTNIKADMFLPHDTYLIIIRKVSRAHVYEVIIERKKKTIDNPAPNQKQTVS